MRVVRQIRSVTGNRGRCDWSAVAGDLNHGFVQEYHNEEHASTYARLAGMLQIVDVS